MRTLGSQLRLSLQAFGWRGLARRIGYFVRLRSGSLLRRLPARDDFDGVGPATWQHRFDLASLRTAYTELSERDSLQQRIVEDAERVLAGELELYGWAWKDAGWPPRWHRNPFTHAEYPRTHWADISDEDSDLGDIKDVWDISRLPFTFLFARAYVLTGDEQYPEAWWVAIEDWAAHNPPNTGVNWRCGQETSLRGIALCFGLSVFGDHSSSTPDRLDLAARVLGASAERVRPTLGYALSQRNNHAISELVFLLSVRHRSERELLRLLLEVLDDQFYPDGSYAQQSFTYHRLAVQALQWLLMTRPDLPAGARSRVIDVLTRSRDFLARCSDPISGWLPNYGHNDGALLFPLSAAHHRDFRPLLTSLGMPNAAEHGEAAIWMEVPEVSNRTSTADVSPTTYLTLRGPRSLAFSRIGTGRHRAAHADQQAIDLWIDGRNVVLDPGTYRYSAPPPWRNALAGPEVHSLALGGETTPVSIGRFLSEGMPAAELLHHGRRGDLEVIVSRRRAGAGSWYRAIVRRGDAYAFIDAAHDTEGRIRWNLGDLQDMSLHIEPAGTRGDTSAIVDDPTSGWLSPLYGLRQSIDVHLVPIGIGDVAHCRLAPTDQHQIDRGDLLRALDGTGMPNVNDLQAEVPRDAADRGSQVTSRDGDNTRGDA